MPNLAAEMEMHAERVRYHKAQIGRHRRLLREAKQQQAEFAARCKELGIQITHSEGIDHG